MFVFIEDSSLDLISPNFQVVESLVCLLNWAFNALNRLKFAFSTMLRETIELDFESKYYLPLWMKKCTLEPNPIFDDHKHTLFGAKASW
jgi:hypothetical protein